MAKRKVKLQIIVDADVSGSIHLTTSPSCMASATHKNKQKKKRKKKKKEETSPMLVEKRKR